MKVELPATVYFDGSRLSDSDARELILAIDSNKASTDFTLDILKSLSDSLIQDGAATKEEIIEFIFN